MNNQHVVPKGDIWHVKGENKMRATKILIAKPMRLPMVEK